MSLKQKHHLLTILVVLVVSAGAFLTWRASAQTEIDPGYDVFSTPDDAQSTETWHLRDGFFTNAAGHGSVAMDVPMTFQGGPNVPNFGSDTVVQRMNIVTPGASNGGDTTPIELAGLSLVGGSTTPTVTVNFADGTMGTYTVAVRQSPLQPSSGHMRFGSDSTFEILDWNINREYDFEPTDPSQPSRIADSTIETTVFDPLSFAQGSGNWSGGGHNVHIVPHLHNPPGHNHFVLPTPTPSPSPSPIPTVTVKPIAG